VPDDGAAVEEGTESPSVGRRQGGPSVTLRSLISATAVALLTVTGPGCTSSTAPASPFATVRIVFRGPTAQRTDLPPSAQACISGVGATHAHPSWRNFSTFPLQPFPPDRYEITFDDVPVDTPASFRINDRNFCDQNPTGAVLRNVFANDVELRQNTTTPGNGDEPGYAFRVSTSGRVTQ
jgi:hypothetical protein